MLPAARSFELRVEGGETRTDRAYNAQIHISKGAAPEEDPRAASRAAKLMHRFREDEVEAKMRDVEESA